MTGVEFERMARDAQTFEAETWADAAALQFGPYICEPNALALALAGRVRRSYHRTTAGLYVVNATVAPRGRVRP